MNRNTSNQWNIIFKRQHIKSSFFGRKSCKRCSSFRCWPSESSIIGNSLTCFLFYIISSMFLGAKGSERILILYCTKDIVGVILGSCQLAIAWMYETVAKCFYDIFLYKCFLSRGIHCYSHGKRLDSLSKRVQPF